MTSSRNPNASGKNAPPTARRSARQQRLAHREANRQLARAGTRGSSGGDLRTLGLWTLAAVVVGAVVIGGAWLLTRTPNASGQPIIAPGVTTPPDIPASGRTLGNPSAPVTIDVYSDFRCTGCFAFAVELEPQLVSKYVQPGKAKMVYHDFITIDSGGVTESRDAANAALCASDQGKFWLYHDWLFANQSAQEAPGYFTIDRLIKIGQAAGLDMSSFEPCVRNGTHLSEIQAAIKAAPSGISSTPTIFVNGKVVVNSVSDQYIPTIDDLSKAIDAILNPSPSPSASASASASASVAPSASASASASASVAPSASASASASVAPTASPS
jgi:protein-disulfide isomerase